MGSKTSFLVLALAFAVVVLIVSDEVAAARELASNHETEVDGLIPSGFYKGFGGVFGKPTTLRCSFGCCDFSGDDCDLCCLTYAEATAYKQAHN